MRFGNVVTISPLLLALGISGACKKQPSINGVTADAGATPVMQPITVDGCLKRGTFADNTWVVLGHTSGGPSTEPASTYQLVNPNADQLRDQQNKQVRVSGTLETDEQIMNG